MRGHIPLPLPQRSATATAAAAARILCPLTPLQLQRPMEQLVSMVNQPGQSGSDAPFPRARALDTAHTIADLEIGIVNGGDNAVRQRVPRQEDGEESVPHYYEVEMQCEPLPSYWTRALGHNAACLRVNADGTCASGSLNLGLVGAPGAVGLTIKASRSPHAVQQFKRSIKDHVENWSDEEWRARLTQEIRDGVWDQDFRGTYAGCTSCGDPARPCDCRTATAERKVFCGRCAERSYHMTPVFFHIAAVVMQVGVLLLITDTRLGARDTRREVHSYGTTEYSQSVVVHGTWSSMYDGHYETVGVPAGDVLGGPVSVDRPARYWRTRFARDDPC